jgi:predicted O-methyltransferase YrrM
LTPGENLVRHQNTLLSLLETATDRRFDMPFQKTFDYEDEFLNEEHRRLGSRLHDTGMIDIGVEGWLLPADAYKLYEMAYFSPGDLLELGSYCGLSATVMNRACTTNGRNQVIVSIDLDAACIEIACQQVRAQPGGDRAHFFAVDAETCVRDLAASKRKFGFVFVDHSHRYEHVVGVCQQLHRVVEIGGFALFHDFNDPRNSAESAPDYGVYQGVMDGLRSDRWDFWGIYGCTGLFRRVGIC